MDHHLEIRRLQDQADNLTNQGNFPYAIIKLQRILKHNPQKRAHIYSRLGNIHAEKKDHIKTHQKYKRAFLVNNPSFPDLRFKWAFVLGKEYRFEEARSELEQFLQINRSHLDALSLMGEISFRLGMYKEADQAYRQIAKKNPGYPNIYEDWASVRYFLEDFDGTKKLLLKEIEGDPKASEARRRLGYILLAEQEYQEAIDWFEKSIEIVDFYSLTWFNWSLVLMLQDKEEEAIVKFNKGLKFLENGIYGNQKREIIETFKNDLEFKERYIVSGKDEQIKAGFQASLEGLKRIILMIEKHNISNKEIIPLEGDSKEIVDNL